MAAINVVTEALERHGCKQRGNDWTCPAHKNGTESNPSLSVTEGAKGAVLHCHSGCSVDDIVNVLGLKKADLFDEKLQREKLSEIDRYSYEDENGSQLFEVIRYVGEESGQKTFRQRHRENGQWVWNLRDVRRVPYRLPELIDAFADGVPVYVVEGEKDVESLRRAGVSATTSPGGAEKWRDEYAEFFRLCTELVTIVADKDEVGRKHAIAIADSLGKVGVATQIVEAKEGHDATDHLVKGFAPHEFVPVDRNAELEPEIDAKESTPVNPMWAKLLDTNDIDNIPKPTYLIDKFLVANALCVVYGKPAAGKSFLLIDWALSIANGKPWFGHETQAGEVLYIVAEGLSGIGPRKLAWQQDKEVPSPVGVKWYPEPVNLLDKAAVERLNEIVDTLQPVVTIVDTLARSMPGAAENDSAPMSTAVENLDYLRRLTQGAVIAAHHTRKDGMEARGHSSLEGAAQTMVRVTNSDEGDITISVQKQKDDEGIEERARLRRVGESVVLYPSLGTLDTPHDGDQKLHAVLRSHSGGEGLSSKMLMGLAGLDERTFHRAKTRLVNAGVIENIGTQRQTRWAIRKSDIADISY